MGISERDGRSGAGERQTMDTQEADAVSVWPDGTGRARNCGLVCWGCWSIWISVVLFFVAVRERARGAKDKVGGLADHALAREATGARWTSAADPVCDDAQRPVTCSTP